MVPPMINRRLWTLALAAVVACGGAKPGPTGAIGAGSGATGSGAVTPVPVQAQAGDAIALWPAIKKGTLANGLTYYILPNGKPEKRVLLWLAVNAGATQEDEDQRGLAHFAEHMAFNGTARFPKAGIVNFLENTGMRFGADLNAFTSFDETVYQLEVPTDDAAVVGKGLDVLRDWAGGISFEQVEVEKERGVVLEEWRLGRGAEERVFDKNVKVMFGGSRYAERLPIGKPEIIKGAMRATLLRFYQDWYRPDLMAVIAVGDLDVPAMEKEIAARFGDLKSPRTSRARQAAGLPTQGQGTRVSVEADPELGSTDVQVLNVFAHRPEATLVDFRRTIAEGLYGAMLNERLSSLSRRKETPFSQASVGVGAFVREVDTFSRSANVKGDRAEDALRALFVEVLRVEKHGFSQAELDRARTNTARFYEQSADAEKTQQSRDLTSEITRNFFEQEFMVGRARERDLALQVLPTLTLADLNALTTTFGGADSRVVLLQGPDRARMPDESRVRAIIAEVETSTIEPWQDKAAATTLMAQAPKAGSITKESTVDNIGVTEWTLSNGARVILKPTDFEADGVTLSGDSPGGLATATAAQFPHARFSDDVAALGGVGDLDDEALDKVMTGKRVEVSATVGDTMDSIDGEASAKDLEAMFQLVHLRMTAPRKDADAFEVWRSNLGEQLDNQLRMPDARFAIESVQLLFKGNPRRKVPTAADLKKIDQDKALAFYRARFGDATDFTFVIVGAFEPAKLRPLVETYLASLPGKGRTEKEKDAGVRRATGVVKNSWALGTEPKARVSISFHGDEAWSRDKDRDVFILGQVLSIRLREILREDMGGVYGVGANGFLARLPRGERTFGIQFGCAPEAVEPLVKAAFAEAAKIGAEGIGADYLDKVKATFLRTRETQLRTNGFWVGWLGSAYRFGDDPTLVLDPGPMMARMTSDNVKAAAKHYLDPKQYFQAVMLPAPAAAATPAAKVPAPVAK